MKRVLFIALITIGLFSFKQEQVQIGVGFESHELTFQPGETTKYRLHYGWINAGEATVSVAPETKEIEGDHCYNLSVFGKTTGIANAMFNVKDKWESFIDTKTLLPKKTTRQIREGKYYLDEVVEFDNNQAKVFWNKKDKVKKSDLYEIPTNVYDIVSGYYFLRNINYDTLNEGDYTTIKAFFDDKLYNFSVCYKGRETIKTTFGKVRAIKLAPSMPKNDIFESDESIYFWLSDDKNKVPLKVKAEMFIGAVEVDIKSYQGLKYDLNMEK
jgi:hypothetical protein